MQLLQTDELHITRIYLADLARGLAYLPSFLSPPLHSEVLQHCITLNRLADTQARGTEASSTEIPQPKHVESSEHNLSTRESFARVFLSDGNRKLRAEHFVRYGEQGHELTYLRGNDNIPAFVKELLLPTILTVPCVAELSNSVGNRTLNWKMTLNIYREHGAALAGFPFHVDIPSNGAVTMILSLMAGARMELVHESDTKNADVRVVDMEPSSLLVLSGEARYNWRHRVLPTNVANKVAQNEIGRVSLVLGCQ